MVSNSMNSSVFSMLIRLRMTKGNRLKGTAVLIRERW